MLHNIRTKLHFFGLNGAILSNFHKLFNFWTQFQAADEASFGGDRAILRACDHPCGHKQTSVTYKKTHHNLIIKNRVDIGAA
jgi:hypothetical protein